MKLGCVSQELDVLSQKCEDEVQAHENDVQNLTCELRNVEASRGKLKQEYSTSETGRESMLAVKVNDNTSTLTTLITCSLNEDL